MMLMPDSVYLVFLFFFVVLFVSTIHPLTSIPACISASSVRSVVFIARLGEYPSCVYSRPNIFEVDRLETYSPHGIFVILWLCIHYAEGLRKNAQPFVVALKF